MAIESLARNTSILALTRLIEFAAGLVRIKLSATFLGVKGLGVFEQLTFFTQQISTFTLLSLPEGLVKQIAENSASSESVAIIRSVLKAYIIMASILASLTLSILMFFSNAVVEYMFGEGQFAEYLYVAFLCFPILILNSIPFSLLKAFKATADIAKARVYIVAVNLIAVVPFIYFFSLDGAVSYIAFSYITTLVINFYFSYKRCLRPNNITLSSVLLAKIEKKYVRELAAFAGFGVSVGVYAIVSEFVIRAIVVSRLGVEGVGLYSPVVMWASMLTGIVLPAFTTYLYPRFCELKDNHEISELINSALRLGSIAISPLLFLGIPYRDYFIRIFYSDDFSAAGLYVPYHFAGLIFYLWWYVFSQVMTPTGRIRQHGIFLTAFYSLNIIVVYLSVNYIGLYGWTLKFIVSPVIFFGAYYFYCRRRFYTGLDWENYKLMMYVLLNTVALIMIVMFVENGAFISYFVGPIQFFFIYFLMQKSERDYLHSSIRKALSAVTPNV